MQLIVFRLREHLYGFTTENIEEITPVLKEAPIPQSPSWVRGLINLRGQIMTLLDLDVLLNGFSPSQELWYTNTVIVNTEDNPIAFMTGKVIGVTDIEPEEIQSVEDSSLITGYVEAYNELVNIIDVHSILKEKEELS
ncbi:chemotaxis protein CheW [Alkalibacterium iburiense]|uniref:Chemotaxis protein CheW n=1 Tax=Alkalibacterium iburiense TaxID=290589 RepID=A0ABN0XPB2_9LACT